MRLAGPAYRRYATRRGPRWEVRWRVHLPGGAVMQRTKGGFPTKGAAEEWAKVLYRAEAEAGGWRFDAHGWPQRGADVNAMQADAVTAERVVDAVRASVVARFPALSPAQRTKTASVLARVVAHTLAEPADRQELAAALDLRPAQLDMADPHHAAALALRDAVCVRDPYADASGGPHDPALAWLAERSLPLAELAGRDPRLLAGLWAALVTGRAYETGRTYWATFAAFVHWCLDTERLTRDPLRTFAKVPRDPDTEKVDPERVLDDAELGEVARAFERHGWADEGTGVLVAGYAALRGGELRGLDCDDFRRVSTEYEVRVLTQPANGTRRHRDTDAAARPTKGRRRVEGAVVWVPLPDDLTPRLDELLERRRADGPDAPVFVGPRGRRLSAATFRDSHWRIVIGVCFPPGHRLHGLTPHGLRVFGMTNWLRNGIDSARCALWGRWASLQVMLDTYARIRPSDERDARDRLNRRQYGGGPPVADPPAGDDDSAVVVDLDRYRHRRSTA